jgi:hypothetical protein
VTSGIALLGLRCKSRGVVNTCGTLFEIFVEESVFRLSIRAVLSTRS